MHSKNQEPFQTAVLKLFHICEFKKIIKCSVKHQYDTYLPCMRVHQGERHLQIYG